MQVPRSYVFGSLGRSFCDHVYVNQLNVRKDQVQSRCLSSNYQTREVGKWKVVLTSWSSKKELKHVCSHQQWRKIWFEFTSRGRVETSVVAT